MSTIKDRLPILNTLRGAHDLPPLKSWRKSKAALEAAILALSDDAPSTKIEFDMTETAQDRMIARVDAEAKAAEKPKGKAAKSGSISSVVKPLIKAGMTNDEIAAKLVIEEPSLLGTWDEEASEWKQTKKWYISWYRSDMKRKGEL